MASDDPKHLSPREARKGRQFFHRTRTFFYAMQMLLLKTTSSHDQVFRGSPAFLVNRLVYQLVYQCSLFTVFHLGSFRRTMIPAMIPTANPVRCPMWSNWCLGASLEPTLGTLIPFLRRAANSTSMFKARNAPVSMPWVKNSGMPSRRIVLLE